MEFFEKAHVAKSNNSSRKEKKSEENVKKQLKQMLYGYKHSDNELIKQSVNVENELEDSSSVSGYSDLNLTNSSVEGDVTQETINSDAKDNILSLESSLNGDDDVDNSKSQSLNLESISEYDEDVKSLSDDISHDKMDNTLSSDSDDTLDSSFIETSTDINSDSDVDSEFDADGLLAAKILKKLNTSKKESKKNRKRKLNEMEAKEVSKPSDITIKYKGPFRPAEESENDINLEELSDGICNIKLPKTKKKCGQKLKANDDHSSEEASAQDSSLDDTSLDSNNTNMSSPFVSVVATDMKSQSLSDVLGEYRHPTIRNLPSDKLNVLSADDYDFFKTGNDSVVDLDMPIDDEVGSLIPEIDNVPAVEEIDLDTTEFDTSIQPNEDAMLDSPQSEEISEREQSTDLEDRMPNNLVRIYYGKNSSCVFILRHPAQMYIHGKVKVRALGGSIEVQGYTLKDDPCEVYAPNYNYAYYLRTLEDQNVYYGLFGKLTSAGLSVAEAEDVVTTLGEYDGVICMQPLKSKKMDFVENNFTIADLFSKPSKNIESCLKKASEILGCSLYLTRPWKCFEENISWRQAIKYGLSKPSRCIVCGGKGTGKSTFLRYYVNKRLSSGPVLLLDLDPGQCEVTVAGNVSATIVSEPLLGPNFTHLKTPQMMLNVGMINTMDNPRRYVAAVETLITHCSNDPRLRELPWIVNTMGMTNNLGLKFISLIILHAQPTCLLQIDSKNVKKRFDFHLYPQTVKNLYFEDFQNDHLFRNVKEENVDYSFVLSHHTENSVKNNFSLAPRDERYLNFLAYFGDLIDMRNGDLLSIVPYEVNLQDLNIGLNVKVSDESVTKVINGKVVALCQHSADTRVFTLSDTPLRCLGAGLVRGVDEARGTVYLVTPARGAAAADTLLYADWAPELRAERPLPPGRRVPYRTAARYDQRQHMFAPKRRFNPVQLLKMSKRT